MIDAALAPIKLQLIRAISIGDFVSLKAGEKFLSGEAASSGVSGPGESWQLQRGRPLEQKP